MPKIKKISKLLVVQILLILGCVVYVLPVSAANTTANTPEFVPGELIVKFRVGTSNHEIKAINASHGTSLLSVNPTANFMRLRIHGKERSVRQLVKDYRASRKVEYAEPNYIVHTTLISNDPDFSQLWALDNSGQTTGTLGADISAPEAWDIQTGDSSVIIAVLDSGADYNHQDLAANMWRNPGEIANNGLDDDGNGFIDDVRGWNFVGDNNDPFDDNSHGTHVAGTIAAAGNNGLGVVGVNWQARIMPLKFLDAQGNGTISDAIEALQYAATMGARLTNNSWGGSGFSLALREAIMAADDAGILFVAAAGNVGDNNDLLPLYPASYNLPNLISVAATDHNDNLAIFSNYGPSSVDLGAPGVSILSTTPGDTYGYKSGTSMATPHVTGIAALLMADLPILSHTGVKARLLNAVDQIATLRGTVTTGGRVNAANALLGVVPPELPEPVSLFEDDMENGPNGWTNSGDTSLWHQSTNRFTSSSTAWYYGIEDIFNYNSGGINQGTITSPAIDLTDVTSSALLFSHFLDTEESSRYDVAFVRISVDGGNTFTDIFTKLTTSGEFVQEALNIAAFDGKIINIQFGFDTVDGFYNKAEGWYLDDVKVVGQPAESPPNTPPLANGGPDQILNDSDGDGRESVTLSGLSSIDPDGEIITYEWREGETLLGSAIESKVDLNVGSHPITLTVTDDTGATGSDEVLVTIQQNQAPAANAGPDQTATDNDGDNREIITLTATGSADPDGTITMYEWQEGQTSLGNGATISPSFTVGVHQVTLTITDNGGATATDLCLVTVKPLPSPTIQTSALKIALLKRGFQYHARGIVSIVDDTGNMIQDARVTAEWLLNGRHLKDISTETDKKGVANLDTGKMVAQSGDLFTINVLNVARTGFIYDPSKNVATSAWATIP